MMIYGYARCSTNESKQDINRQIRELKQLGASDETMYFEYGSGTKRDRVEFNKLLDKVVTGDTIVTTEVSRLSRSTQHLCEIIEIIKNKSLKLVIGSTMTIDCTGGELDPMTNAFLQMSGVFAELERNIISQRVKSGMKNAKAKGKQIGRPTAKYEDIPSKFLKNYKLYLEPSSNINVTELARMCNMSRTTVYKYMNLLEGRYEVLSVTNIKKNIILGDDKYNEYSIKTRHLKDGYIEAKVKYINVKDDKGQIKPGHIYTNDMYKD